MSNLARYVPLKRIVAYVLDANGKSFGDFDKLWVLAFRGMIDLGYNISWEPKTVRLPVEGNKTVPFPSDYIGWSKIGVLNANGEVCSIKVNNALSIFKDTNPNRLDQLTADINNSIPALVSAPWFFNYYQNGSCFNLFGVGGGMIQYGECKIDDKNNIIILNPDFQYDHIILEYLSNPEQDEDYQIELALQEAIIAFIEWKLKLGTEAAYYARCTEARRRLPNKKVTLQTINDVLRSATGQYLKA